MLYWRPAEKDVPVAGLWGRSKCRSSSSRGGTGDAIRDYISQSSRVWRSIGGEHEREHIAEAMIEEESRKDGRGIREAFEP